MSPRILQPFDIREAATLDEAAKIAGRSVKTVKRWAQLDDIGRPVAGRWMISRVALQMHLDSDRPALRAYWAGDRSGPVVMPYFERAGLA